MYYYIYDQFLSQKKYDKILAQIESKITDLGIKDRIIKMSILKSVGELVTDALRKGAQTIVVAGNDKTIHQIVNLISGQDVTLGIIPIGNHNSIAKFLGILDPIQACEIISARKIETINLGEINGDYFINCIKVNGHNLKLECNDKFNIISLSQDNIIGIYNFSPETGVDLPINNQLVINPAATQIAKRVNQRRKFFNPQDNFLEVVIEPQDKKTFVKILKSFVKQTVDKLPESIFRVKKVMIKHPNNTIGSVLVDNFKILKTPLNIKVSDKKLSVIVGKERNF